jgi:hypothetical protein
MTLPPGEIAFVDNQVPALLAGDYDVDLDQTVSGDGVAGTYSFDQTMHVVGPHFGLDAGDVHAVYPSGGSTAVYIETLASIVLSRSALPWMIAAEPDQNESGPLVTPWLMLLLLTPEEIVLPADHSASPTGAHSVLLADYLKPTTGFVGPDFTAGQIANFEAEYPTEYQTLVVDVTAAAFTATAPTLAELPYLAHARDVDADDGELGDENDDGFYSVVIGNRLARGSATGIYLAHLVSAEGFTTRLPPSGLPAGSTTVRLVSLASWTFNGNAGSGNFAGLMANLDVGVPILPTSQPVNPNQAQQLIAGAVADGYVAVAYQTRFGEQTVCWYRGPGQPQLLKANPQPTYTGSTQGLIYDPDTGLFDVSYAVAWETGRMLLLSNRALTISILRWLRRQQKISHLVLDRLLRLSDLGPGEDAPLSSGELAAPRLISDRARRTLADRLSRDLTAPGGAGLFGPPQDPTGLRGWHLRLPGLSPSAADTGPTMAARFRTADQTCTALEPEAVPDDVRQLPRSEAIRGLLASPTARSLLGEVLEPLPDDVAQWLGQLTLLSGLPFNTIVPDARMLPAESIRFFHLDQNWISALREGALSVIDLSERDTTMLELQRPGIHEQATRAAAELRTRRIKRARAARVQRRTRSGRPPSRTAVTDQMPEAPPPMPWSGFLLRSAAVADWPGLTVTAFGDSKGEEPLTMLRLDRVAPTVLIGIAGGTLQRVRIAKPATTLHFGVVHQTPERSTTGVARDLVYLRGLGGRYSAGDQLPNDPYVTVETRPDNQGRAVLEVAALQSLLSSALVAAYQPDTIPQTPPVPTAAFGLQLVAGAEAELFVTGAEQVTIETPTPLRPPADAGSGWR